MKALKILVGIVGVVLVLGVGAAVVTPMVVDPNDYKPRITELAKEHTGRELTIGGDIALTVFPWLGVKLEKVALGNAPGFGAVNFAELDAMQVRVKLLPLLRREIEMDTVEIDGLRLALARNEQGVTNWDDLANAGKDGAGKSGTGDASASGHSASTPAGSSGSDNTPNADDDLPPVSLLALGGVNLRDAAVEWNDAMSGQQVKVQNMQAQTGPVALGQPIEFSLSADVEELVPGIGGHIESRMSVQADQAMQTFTASELEFKATLKGEALAGGQANISGSAASGEFDAAAQRASITGLVIDTGETTLGDLKTKLLVQASATMDLVEQVVSLSEMTLEGALSGTGIPGGELPFRMSATGQANLAQSQLGLGDISINLPRVAAEGVSGSIDIQGSGAAQLDQQRFKLDITSLRGTFSGKALPGGKLDLQASTLADLDLAAQTLQISALSLNAADLQGAGEATVSELLSTPKLAGRITLEQFNPRALAALAGQPLPASADPKALTTASLRTAFVASAESLALDEMALRLDGSNISGNVSIPDLSRQAIEFDLAVDKLLADRYLPAQDAAASGKGGASDDKAKPTLKNAETTARTKSPATPATSAAATAGGLPVDMLRTLDIKGRLRVGQLNAMNLDLAKVDMGLNAKAGLIEVTPLTAALYGGTYKGAMKLDVRGDTATLSVDETVAGVRADKLLAALSIDPGVNLSGGASSLRLKANASGDTVKQVFSFKRLDVDADLAGKDFPKGRLQFGLAADVDVDLKADKLAAKNLDLGFGGARVLGTLAVNKLMSGPSYSADLSVPEFNPRKVLAAMGQKPPVTADKTALSSAKATLKASGDLNSVKLNGINLGLDASKLTGSLAIANLAAPAIAFDLVVDEIDADRYLPPPPKRAKQPKNKNKNKKNNKKNKKNTSKNSPGGTPGSAAALLPTELLRSLNLDGQIKIGRFKINNLQMTSVVFKAKAKDGKVALNPLGAKLYKGSYKGNVAIDATGKRPKISFDEHLSQVELGRVLKALKGKALLTGTADVSMKGSAYGPDEPSLRKTLAGNASFGLRDGQIAGTDLAGLLCDGLSGLGGALAGGKVNTEALIGGLLNQVVKSQAEKNGSANDGGTRFANLTGTLTFEKGIARNKDLRMQSPLLRVTGDGKANLIQERVNYTAVARLVGSCEGQGAVDEKISGVDIPVNVTGSFDKLKYKPQLDGVIAALSSGQQSSKKKASSNKSSNQKKSKPEQKKSKPEDELKRALKGLLLGN